MTLLATFTEYAFVLHTRPYRNTSLIAELFTLTHGRVTGFARGATRVTKQHTTHALHPFTPLWIHYRLTEQAASILQVEQHQPGFLLEGKSLACGFYLNELLLRLLKLYDPHPRLYVHYQHALEQLTDPQSTHSALRLFEKKLLHELGYGLALTHEARTNEPIVPEAVYRFVPEHGFVRLPNLHPAVHDEFYGAHIIAFDQEDFSTPEILHAYMRLTRLALHPLLGDKPLKSRELLVV